MGEKQKSEGRFPHAEMHRIAADFQGRLGFYVEDLTTGETGEYAADQRFPTASICKVPIMVELFRQAEAGRLSLDERRRLQGCLSYSMGALNLLEDEPELTLRDFCRLMIQVSDDLATDFLLEVVGGSSVNSHLDALGLVHTRVNMPMGRWHYRMVGMDDHPFTHENDAQLMAGVQAGEIDFESLPFQDSCENNVTTPREMGTLLKQLHHGQIVSPSASERMMEMLLRGRDRRMIPCFVNPEVPIAHKYGSSGRIKGDVGIVFLPPGPLVIAALAVSREDAVRGDEAIAQISRLAVTAFSPKSIDRE